MALLGDRLGRYRRPTQIGVTIAAALAASLLVRECTTGTPIRSTAPLPDESRGGQRVGPGGGFAFPEIAPPPAPKPDEVLGVTIDRSPAPGSATPVAATVVAPTVRLRFSPASTYFDVIGGSACAPGRSGRLGRSVSVLGETSSAATERIAVQFAGGPSLSLTRANRFTGAVSSSATFSCAGLGDGSGATYTASAFAGDGTLQRTTSGVLPFTFVD